MKFISTFLTICLLITSCASVQSHSVCTLTDIQTTDEQLSCTFYNNSSKTIQSLTIVCTQDAQEIALQQFDIQIPPYAATEILLKFPSDYIQNESESNYIYIAQIVYSDGSIWANPYGSLGVYFS